MRGSTPLERLRPSRLTPFNAGDAFGLLIIRHDSQRGISTSQLPRSLTANGDPLCGVCIMCTYPYQRFEST